MKGTRVHISLWAVALILLIVPISTLIGQNVSATLTGTVTDATGAVIPEAAIVLTSQISGDIRRTTSNAEGYFTFASVPAGSYNIEIQLQGFETWAMKDIVLNAGDKRNLSNIAMKVGTTKEVINVEGAAAQITPVDSGDKSAVISQKVMQNVAIVGQNAAEFIKIMPGMAMTGGAVNQASYAAANEGTGAGPVQNFAPNGLRTAALDITADGAHIIDPGCNCGQSENTNIDMTEELKVDLQSYGADSSKGPTVITAIGKSGGSQFHGEVHLYAKQYSMNANDWRNNAAGIARPETDYWFPGGDIGGPVVIPGTNFNHNHDKLFFYYFMQYYKQDIDNNIYQAVVPTAAMRNGDFSDTAYMSKLNGYAVTGKPNFPGGIVPADKQTAYGKALMNVYPLPNADPATNNGFNYVSASTRYGNMWQFHPRVDYTINDNTKLYVTWNRQRDDGQESLDTLWTGSAQSWVSPTVPYPTPDLQKTHADILTVNLTKVMSPTLTNELVFAYTYLNLPNTLADPTKVQRGPLGLDYKMAFDHPNPDKLIFPQMTGWSDGIANQLQSGYELNGTIYAKKTLPSVSDTVSKVWGTHTAKFGFYWERTYNEQPGSAAVNGQMVFANWGGNSTGNAYADMLAGDITTYTETNFNTVPGFRYLSTDFYGQDSWKVTRRLTLDYGLRVQHLGPWSDVTGYGFAVWNPATYSNNPADVAKLTGLQWHKKDPSVPLSGSPTRMFYYNPRFGFAWDIFGSGRTVLRGGYGVYHYHDEQNVQNAAYGITQGSYSYSFGPTTYNQIGAASTTFQPPGSVNTLDTHDDQQPRVQNYSFTVAERLPWNSVLEVAYVGNKADYLNNYNNNLNNIDLVPFGALFQKYGWLSSYNSTQENAVRPMQNYTSVKIITHSMYSNYNSMQATWNKQAGRFLFMTNYTFSKALGIRGENGAAVGDPTNLSNDYGTLPNNRTHLFNAAYSYNLPDWRVGNSFVRGAIDGWQISGITQLQSGADLQAAVAANSNFNFSYYVPTGTTFMGTTLTSPLQASKDTILGTPDIQLMPLVTCNPNSGLKAHQYVNGNCFTGPAPGNKGNFIFPTMNGPWFWNSDLTLFKNFTFKESQKLQFRVSAFNFLNHPLWTFIANDPNLNLSFNQQGQLSNANFGITGNKTGHRIIQLGVKYVF